MDGTLKLQAIGRGWALGGGAVRDWWVELSDMVRLQMGGLPEQQELCRSEKKKQEVTGLQDGRSHQSPEHYLNHSSHTVLQILLFFNSILRLPIHENSISSFI